MYLYKSTLVLLVLLVVGCVQTPNNSAINNSSSLKLWIEDYIVPQMKDSRVHWNYTLEIRNLGHLGGQAEVTVYTNLFGDYTSADIHDVVLDDSLDFAQLQLGVKKEVLAHYLFLSWWLDHSDYVSPEDSSFRTLLDGMGYNLISSELIDSYPYLEPWNGTEQITCEHLQAIDKLHTNGLVLGEGVASLIQEKCPN